ncbi:MAG: EAL domain-containing protein [Candidatus Accumulibacter sp.]|uniref:EAL domain-containing protein n=1 Tax=Candidatus Accumulibacter affinis TaxID=2954384 RepID=A0A935T932_9PROT|nr:EAL domain-containing protein [Candidatus Accumulibacter affinis]MBP9804602.1 EAL domain-containing protein [Accumulibacter sp.]
MLEITRREHAGQVARKLLATLAEPFFLERHEVLLSASIGISIFPDDGRDTESLLKNADVAMFRAKRRGSNAHIFYSQETNQRSFEQLKLDQSFVRGIPGDQDDSAIARAIISMAHNLRLSVIAEGVETAAQMEFLRAAGCEEVQGYYCSRPLPPQEFAELLPVSKH